MSVERRHSRVSKSFAGQHSFRRAIQLSVHTYRRRADGVVCKEKMYKVFHPFTYLTPFLLFITTSTLLSRIKTIISLNQPIN